ncbi:MAG: AmmeMemoRadiSam system radical SAM enzyme, partial [Candidatus Aenigmatarchaeota archaeon]
MREAMLYEKLESGGVKCGLCSHRCAIAKSKIGACGVRKNIGGKLFSLVYGKPVSMAIDPVEKKPLFHFLPATKSFSFATVGCNLKCEFCQNWEISQFSKGKDISDEIWNDVAPGDIVRQAVDNKCQSISYTYTEPTIFFEYAHDVAKIAKREVLKNIFVTNGYYTQETLEKMKNLIDAANIDLKSFDDGFYRKVCGAKLQPVLESIKNTFEAGIWTEITTLIIPGYNDKPDELRKLAAFIASISKDIPWHISQYHPDYKFDAPRTPVETLRRAFEIGKRAGLNYVYVGNVFGGEHENTFCPKCNAKVIERVGYDVKNNLK